jgi:tetratricopeptide (TPR) repeat protein
MARNVRYYIGVDSSAYAVPTTSIDRVLNQLNDPILKRVERSGLFRREPGIAEHNGILMYKAVDYVTDGRALSDQGKHEEAIAELTRATILDRANVEAWANLALAYERQGSPQKAIAAGTEARRLNPGHYYVNLGLARSHAQLKEWADARARAEDAALKAPGVVEEVNAIVLAARSSFSAGNAERGCTLLQRARALGAPPEIQADITTRGCIR